MHADAFPRQLPRDDKGLGQAIALAVGLHVLLALLFFLAWKWSPVRNTQAAAGSPVIEASLLISTADIRAAEQAMADAPVPPPLPTPLDEVAEEDTVPPPQPIPEPRPQDSPTPQQQIAQERVPVPDTKDQDEASLLAISKEKALREQEAKRRQQQIDLTEQKRQEEAQKQQRLAKQQEEADKKKLADEKKLAADKLAEIRRLKAQAAKEANQAEQKLRQLNDARAARQTSAASAPAASSAGSGAPQGNNGVDANLSGQYAAAIQKAVLDQWIRPDSVPRGQRCRITIRQLPGGDVVDVEVSPSCPYDEAGKRSVEAAVRRAQPLPYRGFESVFNRTLNFNFEAQDR